MDSDKEEPGGDCIIEETPAMDSDDDGDVSVTWEEPVVLPRVGHQYQAEIPPLITEFERLQLIKIPTDAEVVDNVAHSFRVGLPIPIMWVTNEFPRSKPHTKESSEYKKRQQKNSNSNKEASKLKTTEPSDVALDCENRSGPISKDGKRTVKKKYKDNSYFPAPGCLGSSWSDFEKESFLLGVYIFGKNFVKLKRFVESKEMGDILSYYYGKFYSSDEHSRKKTSKKPVHGEAIFKGCRQQEFLSRLLPRVPDKSHNTLVEVSKTFGEGKISLEKYVFTLKATVGLGILIEVVGIGKGKRDFTGFEPPITNQATHRGLPDKAFSTLKIEEIIRLLTGDFHLSQARLNDLFQEAIWPRLQIKGWQSEEPKNRMNTRSKQSLVFFVPGVKDFSIRKFVKGEHYFESVTEVLNKVASDSRLLELEVEPAKGSIQNQENGWGEKKMKMDKGGHPDHQHHSYLPAQVSKSSLDLMKFTIIDTSLGDGEDSFLVRELRSLPMETTNISTPTSPREKYEDDFEEPVHEPDAADMANSQGDSITSRSTQDMSDGIVHSEFSDCAITVSKQEMLIDCPDHTNVTLDNHRDPNAGKPDKASRETTECQLSRRRKPGQSNNSSPVTKLRRLGSPSAIENMVSEVRSSQEKVSTSPSAKGSPEENCVGKSVSQEKYPPRILFDLNIPFVPFDFETGEPFITEVENSQNDPYSKESLFSSSDVASAEQQPGVIVGGRAQETGH